MKLARESEEVVPNAVKHGGEPRAEPCWERTLPGGAIHVYPGCAFWRWCVFIGPPGSDVAGISPCVYDSPILAMERGQAAYDKLLKGEQPEKDWTG